MTLKIGIIGSSPGNGHPYSWSAIVNGYNEKYMKMCPFPVIPNYLADEKWPESMIKNATVNSIWTQEQSISEHIAKASKIKHVCTDISLLKDLSDCIMLARDDSENHLKFAKDFLISGKPIYIDKPIANSLEKLYEIYKYQQYEGQIFTCSALRYSPELKLSNADKKEIGDIVRIEASINNSWEKYSVHIIEPLLKILDPYDEPEIIEKTLMHKDKVELEVKWKSGVTTSISTLGNVNKPVKIKVIGKKGKKVLIAKNTFVAFKSAIEDFIDGVIKKECKSSFDFNFKVVSLIEKGI
tara:strand:+ start:617 stop:1507 length:891 start_codon:yes stop_codon:yes gene_type:complete